MGLSGSPHNSSLITWLLLQVHDSLSTGINTSHQPAIKKTYTHASALFSIQFNNVVHQKRNFPFHSLSIEFLEILFLSTKYKRVKERRKGSPSFESLIYLCKLSFEQRTQIMTLQRIVTSIHKEISMSPLSFFIFLQKPLYSIIYKIYTYILSVDFDTTVMLTVAWKVYGKLSHALFLWHATNLALSLSLVLHKEGEILCSLFFTAIIVSIIIIFTVASRISHYSHGVCCVTKDELAPKQARTVFWKHTDIFCRRPF